MYSITALFLESFIKAVLEDDTFSVYDAKFEFTEPANYASFYILPTPPTSNFSNLDSESVDATGDIKTFKYKETQIITIKVDFRGESCFSNMALFKKSFYKQDFKDLLKDAGFGWFGFASMPEAISNIQGSSVNVGMTATIKLSTVEIILDTSPVIKSFNVTTSIKKDLNNG